MAHTRKPDVTVFLKVRPEVASERRAKAGRPIELFHDLATQHAVAAGYDITIEELRREGERILIVDGEQPADRVTAAIVEELGVAHLLARS